MNDALFHIRLITGGQSGVDRAVLDFALKNNMACGGWCPAGRWAEDGRIPDIYPLKETDSAHPDERTRLNIQSSDGTLIIYDQHMDRGTKLTLSLARQLNIPHQVCNLHMPFDMDGLNRWISSEGIKSLNIAGPRASNAPGIYHKTMAFLEQWAG